jgi:hypothetical protein
MTSKATLPFPESGAYADAFQMPLALIKLAFFFSGTRLLVTTGVPREHRRPQVYAGRRS